jgi:hypothetical protein
MCVCNALFVSDAQDEFCEEGREGKVIFNTELSCTTYESIAAHYCLFVQSTILGRLERKYESVINVFVGHSHNITRRALEKQCVLQNIFEMSNDRDPGISDLVKKLWDDPNFSASYTGSTSMQIALKLERNLDLSLGRLQSILSDMPTYVFHVSSRRRFKRRATFVHGVGKLWQADLAEMFEFDGYKYFLCVVDVFSRKIFTFALKNKEAPTVADAFNRIFKEAGTCEKLETDQGSEFIGNKTFFKDHKVFWKAKRGLNKASFAEHSIWRVKGSCSFF